MTVAQLSLTSLPPLPHPQRNKDNALHYAAFIGDNASLNTLLQAGYDINAQDDFGHTPLDLAIYNHQTNAAVFLINHGDLTHNGVRYLALALSLDNKEIAHAIVHHPQFDGDSAAYRAFSSNQIDILDYLQSEQIDMPMTKTMLIAKMLAHRFSLDGEVELTIDSRQFFVELEGHLNKITAAECYLSFKEYVESLQKLPLLPEHFDIYLQTLEALHFAANANIDGNLYMNKLYESYLSEVPIPILIPSGWDGHAVGIVIYGDTLYKCNRGQGSDYEHGIVAYNIGNFQGFDAALFDELIIALGSSDFIQVELDEILHLTEIGRYDATAQTVGNCAWYSIIESVHAILLAQGGQEVANNIYQDWQDFDLTNSLAQLQNIGTDSANEILDAVLTDILLNQHDANNENHIERALDILQFVDNPHALLFSIDDSEFEHALFDNMTNYIDIYQNSRWYDYGYFLLDSYLDMINFSLTDQTYDHYAQTVDKGLHLSHFLTKHPDLFSAIAIPSTSEPTPTLRWEDVFGQSHIACATNEPIHSLSSPVNPVSLPLMIENMVEVTEMAKVLI